MTNSTKYQNFVNADGLELVINVTNGLAYCSISAAARMLQTPQQTISDAVKPYRDFELITAEIQTTQGLRTARLLTSQHLGILALQYNRELALAMLSAGANVYMLGLAGYQINASKPEPQQYTAVLRPSAANRLIAEDIRSITDTLFDNPRLAQFLIDQTIDQCFSKALPSTEVPLKGVVEIAESLGLAVNIHNRSALGRFISQLGTHKQLKEERLCNGQMRTINCYQVTPEIESDIKAYFNR